MERNKRNTIVTIGIGIVVLLGVLLILLLPGSDFSDLVRQDLSEIRTGFNDLGEQVARLKIDIEALKDQITRVEEQFSSLQPF